MTDYTDYCEMYEWFFEKYGREPTDEELELFIADQMAYVSDMAYESSRGRDAP